MITRQDAYRLRRLIERAAQFLDDDDALNGVELFPLYQLNYSYSVGDKFRYNFKLYRVVQAHISQPDWRPDELPALYTEVAPSGTIPVWRQPTGAQDAYNIGDKVHYPDIDGPVYESLIDANIWSPEAYPSGWRQLDS